MTEWQVAGITPLDLAAPVWFVLCWLAYTLFAERRQDRPNLSGTMHRYRELWMQTLLGRDNRMVDIQIIANLMRSASFFASTTVLIIAGLIAVLGARLQAMAMIRELPFAADSPPLLWDLKVLLLIVLFVYAFYKFTWALRHYNYCLVLIGAIPGPSQLTDGSRRIAERAARVASSTARHFNHGIRAYYFGLAALSWFIQPWLFAALTVWVVLVLYRREFRSRLLQTLGTPEEAPETVPTAPRDDR
jgi:uncharacterized membrane protein